ncbi:2,3-bisphosphoglycerate-independent phosphoglycerate mutase [Candidatus Microgenomates bacterium]|nr:2,3-bisphosphoglycerate-independent phosphoglycerate mutase [Candidatus Microgenomates bacterium]
MPMQSVILIVLDGFGLAPPGPGYAVYLANPTNINALLYTYPNTTLKASGEAVGLPPTDVGNTEVGHLNMGAGRVVYQDLPRINMSIADGSFFQNESLQHTKRHLDQTKGKLHIIGLVGDGFVHASVEHLHALLYFAKENNIQNTFVHCITDGRDSPPRSAHGTIALLEEKLAALKIGKIASVMGRYYAMDRDRRWERIEKAYRCLTTGIGISANSALEAVDQSYKQDRTDEFIDPTVIMENGKPRACIEEGDAVIFFNYRIDRPRELTKAFVLDEFERDANIITSFDPYAGRHTQGGGPDIKNQILNKPFERGPKIPNLFFVTMTEYEKTMPVHVAFPPGIVNIPLGRVVSDKGYAQLRMAESEKERFVTDYFNGHREQAFPLEDRLIIPSPKVPTYDMKPEMSAYELTETLIKNIRDDKYKFILINFANADMVGHTGNIEASIRAVKTLDDCLNRIVQAALGLNYMIMITADHGNVEQKINPQTGQISTEHTANPVPFVAISNQLQGRMVKLQSGILADIAPTILSVLEIPIPGDMTGRNLLEEL